MPKSRTNLKTLSYIALSAALLSVCSWITIPFFAIPFTMQTFAVFLMLMLVGGWRGLLALCVYLAIGCLGAPVFSGFQSGVSVLAGPTGGYLWGFLVTALVYLVFEKLFRSQKTEYPALVLGLVFCYLCGTLWYSLMFVHDFLSALSLCVLPFILPDLIKLTLAFLIAHRLRRLKIGLN